MRSLPEAAARRLALVGLAVLCLLGLSASGGPAWLCAAGLAGGGLWWWLRRRGRPAGVAGRLRVLEQARLCEGSALQLVEVEGRRLLLGTGPGGPRLLARLAQEEDDAGGAP